jgi:uncharacterized protein YkwD
MTRRLFAVLAVVVACSLAAADDKKDELKLSKDEKALLELTNAERKAKDLDPLKPNAKLFAAARARAANMAKQEKLEHDLDGKGVAERVADAGYEPAGVAENIGWNFATPKGAVEGWMNSEGHRANLLGKDYTEVGLAVAKSAKGELYWVQVFAKPVPD